MTTLTAIPPSQRLMVSTAEAAALCSMTSEDSFRRWARYNGVRYVSGARGRYSVADINAALDRSRRRGAFARR